MITEGCLWTRSSTEKGNFNSCLPHVFASCFSYKIWISSENIATLAAVQGLCLPIKKRRGHFLKLPGFSCRVLEPLLNFTFRRLFRPSAQWLYTSLSQSKTFPTCLISSGPVWQRRLAWGEAVQNLARVDSKRRPANSQWESSSCGRKRQRTGRKVIFNNFPLRIFHISRDCQIKKNVFRRRNRRRKHVQR